MTLVSDLIAARAATLEWISVPAHVAEGPAQVRHKDGWLVCEVPSDEYARLIAAAPELLEALKRFDIGYEPIFNPFTRADFEAARAAISKALGEPHA